MNERIQELFNKASVYAYEQNPGENSYGRPVDENKYEEERYTKFAELIVLECAGITLDYKNDDYYNGWCDHSAEILEHFGVEE